MFFFLSGSKYSGNKHFKKSFVRTSRKDGGMTCMDAMLNPKASQDCKLLLYSSFGLHGITLLKTKESDAILRTYEMRLMTEMA